MFPVTSTASARSNLNGKKAVEQASIRCIGHVNVVVATQASAIQRVLKAVEEQCYGAWGFCNASTVNLARRNILFREALGRMTLFNDGIGIDIASRLLYGKAFPENLNGTDLTPRILHRLQLTTPVFLLGGKPGVAELAAEALRKKYPNITVVGVQHGSFRNRKIQQ